ncbi:DNA-binding protein [Haemophilus influenzae]|uniref:DNA-binding protein n=1 Tax=Haemophilus influenzae TaxID=727 RepID=UPI000DD33072|nr:DNA-binding protein [Haemophilus influenzae]
MNGQNAICINVQIYAPYVTLKKYAELTGLSLDKVRKMRAAGELPIADKKAERGSVLVNLIAIAKQAAKQE